jgi:galactose-1-phosphate uridylyltransferase
MHQGIDQDEVETMVECPACQSCPVCNDARVVTPAKRGHYVHVRSFPQAVCPRCRHYGKSLNCALCSGTNAVTPGAAENWQQANPQARRASRPEMPAVNLDPWKDEQ